MPDPRAATLVSADPMRTNDSPPLRGVGWLCELRTLGISSSPRRGDQRQRTRVPSQVSPPAIRAISSRKALDKFTVRQALRDTTALRDGYLQSNALVA